MKVYRLEKNGYGVFCGWRTSLSPRYSDDALYASYGYTCNRKYQSQENWRSACESVDKLIEYFGSDFAFLLSGGASLVEYTIDKRHIRFSLLEERIEVTFNAEKIKHKQVMIEGEDTVKEEKQSAKTVKEAIWSYSLTSNPMTITAKMTFATLTP